MKKDFQICCYVNELKIELNLFVGIHVFLTLELEECLLIFFIENIVNKNVIESDHALKIRYTISLSTQKDVINPGANRLRKCFSHNSLIVNIVQTIHGSRTPLMVTE